MIEPEDGVAVIQIFGVEQGILDFFIPVGAFEFLCIQPHSDGASVPDKSRVLLWILG